MAYTPTERLGARRQLLAFAAVAALASACGNDEDFPTDPEGTPARLDVIAGDSQTATVATQLPSPVVIVVTDAAGRPVAGRTPTFVPSGHGSVELLGDVSDALGRLRVRWTLDTTAGTNTLTATLPGLDPVVVTATGTAGPPARADAIGATTFAGATGRALPESLVVRVVDAYGNPVSDVPVAWAVTAGGGTLAPATGSTDAAGRAASEWTLGLAGENSATATAQSTVGGLALAVQEVAAGLAYTLSLHDALPIYRKSVV